ncbi:MAG: NAD(P)-dependent oxidoreductase [Chloroflexota bacterium]|nr:NAD(P)-dependent oxidoreductase [Chloroflexota bacterium]MDE2920494.1 NAD(P)-dependent oxidoreductase [Chloroflexota bacterium]
MADSLPDTIPDERTLDEVMSRPSVGLIESIARGSGDLLVLGAGGKMGPTTARMARRAFEAAGRDGEVIAVSRFSDPAARAGLEAAGVQTLSGDLLEPQFLRELPDAPEVVFMAGRKFGSTGAEHLTWAMNAHLPGLVARRFREARCVVFSTAAVYPFVSTDGPGAGEDLAPEPIGEYAQSCLARERMFEHAAHTWGTRSALIRLSYALDLRYGVLHDVGASVRDGRPVDVSMSTASVIWQGDACDLILRTLEHTADPPLTLNVSGLEPIRLREVAVALGELLDVEPEFEGSESDSALFVDCRRMAELAGEPMTPLRTVLSWTADWLRSGGRTLDKPTHFEVRDGRF